MTIGRNDPCPCGSGKKHKRCCLVQDAGSPGCIDMGSLMNEVSDKLTGKEFSSLEELQAELDTNMQQKNSAPLTDFHGLSSEQMHRFLHFPFESQHLIQFKEDITPSSTVPILALFSLLVEAIGDKGLKPTAKGNLPQRFCQEAAVTFWGEEYETHTKYHSIRSEMDFFEMHCLKLVAQLAGLIRKYKGKFILSVKCRKKIAAHGVEAMYSELFMAYVTKFNWAYRYGYQEIPLIQQAFLFTLFNLGKHGSTSRPETFYEDIFLKAFPAVFSEIDETPYQTVEDAARTSYSYRTLQDFCRYFGLAELTVTSKDTFSRDYAIKKTPLLDQFISFTL